MVLTKISISLWHSGCIFKIYSPTEIVFYYLDMSTSLLLSSLKMLIIMRDSVLLVGVVILFAVTQDLIVTNAMPMSTMGTITGLLHFPW